MRDVYEQIGLWQKIAPSRPAPQPIRTRIGGYAVMVAGVLGASALSVVVLAGLTWYFFQGSSSWHRVGDFAMAVLSDIVIWVFVCLYIIKLGERLAAVDGLQRLREDLRPPVVVLRPFEENLRQRVGGYIAATRRIWRSESAEELIGRTMERIGPFVAIGRPGDWLCPLGAARLYVSREEWREKVELLVRNAAAIVIMPAANRSAYWELDVVARNVNPKRILLLVPDARVRPLGYAHAKAAVMKALGWSIPQHGSNTEAFMLDDTGNPVPLTLGLAEFSENQIGRFADRIAALGPPKPHEVPVVAAKPEEPKRGAMAGPRSPAARTVAVSTVAPAPAEYSSAAPSSGFVSRLWRHSSLAYLRSYLLPTGGAIFWLALFAVVIAQNIRMGESYAANIAMAVIGIPWLAYFVVRIAALASLRTHPLGKAISAHGPLPVIMRDIDADFAGRDLDNPGPLKVGERWICYASDRVEMVQRADAFVWVYGEIVDLGKGVERHQLLMWTRNRVAHELPMSAEEVEQSIAQLKRTMPWLYFGYTASAEESFDVDNAEFIASVKERRAKIARGMAVDEKVFH